MTVTEPATMITDYLLAGMCSVFAFRLHRGLSERRVGLWVTAFSVAVVAAVAGGTAHGFRLPLGHWWIVVWRFTLVAISVTAVLLIAAGVESARRPEVDHQQARRDGYDWLRRAIAISVAGLAVLVLRLAPHPNFNHNDLYHVIQMGGLFCLYRGATCLHQKTAVQ